MPGSIKGSSICRARIGVHPIGIAVQAVSLHTGSAQSISPSPLLSLLSKQSSPRPPELVLCPDPPGPLAPSPGAIPPVEGLPAAAATRRAAAAEAPSKLRLIMARVYQDIGHTETCRHRARWGGGSACHAVPRGSRRTVCDQGV